MKKSFAVFLSLLGMVSLFAIFVPNVCSQPENVQVLSYSWCVSPDGDYIVVVGEVQNIGSDNIDYIYLEGIIYTKDGLDRASSYTMVYSRQIIPQQKAPFFMYFGLENSYTYDFSWLSIGIDDVRLSVVNANPIDSYQYQELEIIGDASQIDSDGLFAVTGSIRNNGDQASGRLLVVATFYNASGNVIAVGHTDYLTPESLLPSQTASFTVTPFYPTTQFSTQITAYSLLIQTEAPIIPEFPSWVILPMFLIATAVIIICRIFFGKQNTLKERERAH